EFWLAPSPISACHGVGVSLRECLREGVWSPGRLPGSFIQSHRSMRERLSLSLSVPPLLADLKAIDNPSTTVTGCKSTAGQCLFCRQPDLSGAPITITIIMQIRVHLLSLTFLIT